MPKLDSYDSEAYVNLGASVTPQHLCTTMISGNIDGNPFSSVHIHSFTIPTDVLIQKHDHMRFARRTRIFGKV